MKSGELIWIDHHGVHPAVIINVLDDGRILVVIGTGTLRPDDPTMITIRHREPTGFALGLDKTTYFYESKIAILETGRVHREMKKRGSLLEML
jgi:hypothetical protein